MSSKNNSRICNAYKCSAEATTSRIIDGSLFWFCDNHQTVLGHGKSAIIIDVVASEKLNPTTILRRFNFKVAGFTKEDLFSTIDYLLSIGEIVDVDGNYFISNHQQKCKFYGCNLHKHKDFQYCSNHKNLPPMDQVDIIMNTVRDSPKNAAIIEFETNIDIKIVKSILFQLIKFGLVQKEKKGVTNYYIQR